MPEKRKGKKNEIVPVIPALEGEVLKAGELSQAEKDDRCQRDFEEIMEFIEEVDGSFWNS